jgi:hypothetical protein
MKPVKIYSEIAMFTAEIIQKRIFERPFVPLRIVTSSGQSYDILHPELVLVGKRDLMVGTASNDNPTIYQVANRVALMHVTDLQDLPQATPAGKNGAPSK